MSNTYGENLRLTIFGQSHSPAIGMTLEGIPAGAKINMEKLQKFMDRRAPGRDALSTARKEADVPEFISGIKENVTCGTPITAIIRNNDTRSKDYSKLKYIPRPGHADYTAEIKYKGNQDFAGGGHFSGRLTAPLCIAGGICRQLLEKEGIKIYARVKSIGPVCDSGNLEEECMRIEKKKKAGTTEGGRCPAEYLEEKTIPVLDDECGRNMEEYILKKKAEGDSVGGVIECTITGLPAGLGEHMFSGMENKISQIIFGIPAVKGIEFGAGFGAAQMTGSENNDPFCIEDGRVMTATNNCGGILGGITNGMPLTFRTAVKPTPSIYKPQKSVDLRTMEETELIIEGRHDPCIAIRAVPCVEAAAAVAVYDAFLGNKGDYLNADIDF